MSAPEKVCEYHPVNTEIASHVLFHYGHGGYQPGGFVDALITAIAKADESNRQRLSVAFPGYVRAVNMIERDRAGASVLKLIAIGRSGAYYATPDLVVDEELGIRLCAHVYPERTADSALPYRYCDEPAMDGSRFCEWHDGPDRGAIDDAARDRAIDQAMGI